MKSQKSNSISLPLARTPAPPVRYPNTHIYANVEGTGCGRGGINDDGINVKC